MKIVKTIMVPILMSNIAIARNAETHRRYLEKKRESEMKLYEKDKDNFSSKQNESDSKDNKTKDKDGEENNHINDCSNDE